MIKLIRNGSTGRVGRRQGGRKVKKKKKIE